MTMNRRTFLRLTGTTAVCMCAGALGVSGCGGKPTSDTPSAPEQSYRVQDHQVIVELSMVPALIDVGGAVKFITTDQGGSELKIIVVHAAKNHYQAYTNSCTHNGKELDYLHQDQRLACCGRNSQFDLAGNVIRGPAEKVLQRYDTRLAGESLFIEI